ncbi:ketopantoate reductase family protein [Elioraea sp.]|uniref:ketopantoate reductase family protein n=1 Tax=Elioraea sp. TaxID=2185103 RepID=UPI0021DD1BD7|nr:ketopantoate reductase family protein [Elioraea sp.]GIX11890.1 MAG: 2-dehydropantoate 2-reductase [Elioraea sp.]
MRVLVLGAGAVGGYFGGRLAQAGSAEVAFLVRTGRKAQLERDGLVIESPAGDARLAVTALAAEDLSRAGDWDIVLLTAKAYDLDGAIAAIRPAIGESTAVLPLLNGLSHIETLVAAFGAPRVLGGLAKIQATLTPQGVVRHLAPVQILEFGELDGALSPRALALKRAFDATPVRAEAVGDIRGRMWEKLVFLGTLAMATVLMRANLGEIAAVPGGQDWLDRLLERNAAIAAAHGHPVREHALEREFRPFFRSSPAAAASMLRDLEAGGRVESDHILGFLLQAARRAGVDATLHEAAWLHAKAYENRRDAGRLPAR